MSPSRNDSLWQRPARPSRGPVPSHSLDDIAAAASALARRDGLSAVTMRAVAAELSTTAGALYRYLKSRDELLDLMVDRAMGRCHYPDGTGVEAVVDAAVEVLRIYREDPWLAEIRQARTVPGPSALAFFDHCLTVLRPASAQSAMQAAALALGTVVAFVRPSPEVDWSGLDPVRHPALAAALTTAAPGPSVPDLFQRMVRGAVRAVLD